MSQQWERVIICRAVSDGLTPGSETGFVCSMCQEPLQVTPQGLAILRTHGGELLCNPCGLLYVHVADEEIARTELSPAAKTQLDAGNKSPLANWTRNHRRSRYG